MRTWQERAVLLTYGTVGVLATVLVVAFILLMLFGCGPVHPPAPPPIPPAPVPVTHTVRIEVYKGAISEDHKGYGATVTLGEQSMTADAAGNAEFIAVSPGDYPLRVALVDYKAHEERIAVASTITVKISLELDRPKQVRGRLCAQGRALTYCDSGEPFQWRGVTAFALAEQIAHGREAEAVAFMRWARDTGFNGLRVLMMARGLFTLSPTEGRAALPRLLALALDNDCYLELVALADTDANGFKATDAFEQVTAIGQLAATVDHALGQVANEYEHGSQASAVRDIDRLREYGRAFPDRVLFTLSAPFDDEATEPQGEYITRHLDRGRDPWNQIRRVRELENVEAATNKPVINDEPIGAAEPGTPGQRLYDSQYFFALGVLNAGFGIDGTFHCQDCLRSIVPGPRQQESARAFIEGMRLIPAGRRFKNARWADSPVRDARFSDQAGQQNTTVRAYSFVGDGAGELVLVGVTGDPGIDMQNGWRLGATLAERPGVRVLRVEK